MTDGYELTSVQQGLEEGARNVSIQERDRDRALLQNLDRLLWQAEDDCTKGAQTPRPGIARAVQELSPTGLETLTAAPDLTPPQLIDAIFQVQDVVMERLRTRHEAEWGVEFGDTQKGQDWVA